MFSAVPTEEIAFGMALFVDAASRASGHQLTPSSPASRRDRREGEQMFIALSFGIHEAIDDQKRAALLKTHLSRAFFSVWENYRGDVRRPSICARILGFCYLMEKTRGSIVEAWAPEDGAEPERVLLNPLIIRALANVTLTETGVLSESALLAQINAFEQDNFDARFPAPKPELQEAEWPAGSGEMAKLLRERDWSATFFGPIEHWPATLRTSIDLVLACAFPMVVLWGPDLYQFYNDGYRNIMGAKHPSGLGQATRDCWPEVWHINEPIYKRAQRGETLTFEDQLYPIVRYGFLEDAYFTLCYSPIRNEAAVVQGVLVTVFETTSRSKVGYERDAESDPSYSGTDEPKRFRN